MQVYAKVWALWGTSILSKNSYLYLIYIKEIINSIKLLDFK